MKLGPQKNHRRSIRLKEYDYASPGAYFVTTVISRRENLLAEIRDGDVDLSPYGRIVARAWCNLPNHYPHVRLDAFMVMPNHVHGILVFSDTAVGAGLPSFAGAGTNPMVNDPAPNPDATQTCPYDGNPHRSLGEVMRAFKSFSARRINLLRGTPGQPVWQRNYYERVVRNERELEAIRAYIQANPQNWADDEENAGGIEG